MRDEPLEEDQRWLRQAREDLHWVHHLTQEEAVPLVASMLGDRE
jgi:hypothetical protein